MAKAERAEGKPVVDPEVIPDWTVITGLRRTNLPDVVEEHDRLTARVKADKARLDELKQIGAKLLIKAGVKTVMCNGLRVTKVDGTSSRLDKQLLYKLGGDKVMTWLKKATVYSPYTTLLVKRNGEVEDES